MRSIHVPRLAAVLALAGAFALAAAPAAAVQILLTSSLDGDQETPPVVTDGNGSASLTYDTDTNLLSWTITYSDLTGTTNNAHFHGPAEIGEGPAGVQVPIAFTSGVTADTLIGSATITETQEAQLLDELWYINIHSTFRPGGEIRGQVLLVPEPGLAVLAALGLAFLGVRARASQA